MENLGDVKNLTKNLARLFFSGSLQIARQL